MSSGQLYSHPRRRTSASVISRLNLAFCTSSSTSGREITSGGAISSRALSIAIFDASSQVTLPTGFAPLPSGALTMKVTTLDIGTAIDLRDFEVDDLTKGAVRFAGDTIKLN